MSKNIIKIGCQMGNINRQELMQKLGVTDAQFRSSAKAYMDHSPEFRKKYEPYINKKNIKSDTVRMLINHCYGDEVELQIVVAL